MALASAQNVCVRYGDAVLLDNAVLQIQEGERVCLMGRNGTGKTTLLRIMAGEIAPNSGDTAYRQGVRTAYLPQEVPEGLSGTVREVVASGVTADIKESHVKRGDDWWTADHAVERAVSLVDLNPDGRFETLSAGARRRALLARGLAREPDLLLLDEPTNHLDISSIAWLESFLPKFPGSILFVTHDRMFVRKMATRIVELDRGRLINWQCGYGDYLKRKEAALAAEERGNETFDKKLAEEEAWLRKGIKARRTRNEGRVRALLRMREERSRRRAHAGRAKMDIQEAERSGDMVIEARNIEFGYGGPPVVEDFSTTIARGDKIGIIGPNGAGKTTLLRLLLGDLEPKRGSVRHGTKLEIAYFDQLRARLDGNASVADNVGEGTDTLTINGKKRHIIGYLEDFLFTPDRARSPVRVLSGGERNRLLLAKLFTRPANVMVLDEPTNDLDAETLELLESLLVEFNGTVLLVSHDRAFLNNVVTGTLAFEGGGKVNEYVGGYDDWLRQRKTAEAESGSGGKIANKTGADQPAKERPRKLSYNQQRELKAKRGELETMPERLEAMESELRELQLAMADSSFYQQGPGEIAAAKAKLESLEAEIQETYRQWERLEEEVEELAALE